MTSLPASSHKPPAAAAPAKAVSRFDSVASMPASQQEPKPVKGKSFPTQNWALSHSSPRRTLAEDVSHDCMYQTTKPGDEMLWADAVSV